MHTLQLSPSSSLLAPLLSLEAAPAAQPPAAGRSVVLTDVAAENCPHRPLEPLARKRTV